MNIHEIHQSVKGHKRSVRVGRGAGSGAGKTAGRGQKGLGSRSGANYLRGYVGGQMQLKARLPKVGFSNAAFATVYVPVNLCWLNQTFEANAEVTPTLIGQKGTTVRRDSLVKILGTGELDKPLVVHAHHFSKTAREKIEKAGGKAVVIKLEAKAATNEKK